MFVLPYLVGDMKFVVKNIFFFVLLFLLFACGDKGDGKVSKGHRDAIKIECNDDPDKKLCGLEVRQRFLEEGNDFVTFDDLNKAQIKRVKLECIRSKKYGLEAANKWIKFGINQLGYKRIIVITSKKNVININLNKKLGFKTINNNNKNNLWQKMVYK